MLKLKKLALKIALPAASALATVSALAADPGVITPPTVPTGVTTFTKSNLWTQIGIVVNWVVALIGIASLIFLLYGAYMYMSSGQNEDNLKKAKSTLLYGVIGAVVAVLAFSIFTFSKSLVE